MLGNDLVGTDNKFSQYHNPLEDGKGWRQPELQHFRMQSEVNAIGFPKISRQVKKKKKTRCMWEIFRYLKCLRTK